MNHLITTNPNAINKQQTLIHQWTTNLAKETKLVYHNKHTFEAYNELRQFPQMTSTKQSKPTIQKKNNKWNRI